VGRSAASSATASAMICAAVIEPGSPNGLPGWPRKFQSMVP
jgi:hypothetical protein